MFLKIITILKDKQQIINKKIILTVFLQKDINN